MLRKIMIAAGSVLAVVLLSGAVFVSARQNLRFDDTTYPDVAASTDSAVVERGRYIVMTAGCIGCHATATSFATSRPVPDVTAIRRNGRRTPAAPTSHSSAGSCSTFRRASSTRAT